MIAVWFPWGDLKGCLGLIHDIALYLQQNGANFDITVNAPLPYPVILPNTFVVDRENIRSVNMVDNIAWQICKLVKKAGSIN